MKIAVQMIGVATTFFWLFLIVFFISVVYSVKDVQFDMGEPQIVLASEDELLFSLPITIDNKGYYGIGSFNVSTDILDKEGFQVARGSTFVPVIERNRKTVITHNLTVKTNDLLRISQICLFNDTELAVQATFALELAEVIPVQASKNFSIDWGAPLHNFTVGEVEYTASNVTHVTANIPINFENHAFFDLSGVAQINMYNSTDVLVGEGQATFEVAQGERYGGNVRFYVPRRGITDTGCLEVNLATPLFKSESLVFPYG